MKKTEAATALEAALESPAARRNLKALYGKEGAPAGMERIRALVRASGLGDRPGAIVVSAPGRTELGGNHTDHNRGRVLAGAVRLDAVAVCAPRGDMIVDMPLVDFGDPIRVDLGDLSALPKEKGTTAALIRGVAAALAAKGYSIGGFDAALESAVPVGSGLSSSACVEVLLGAAMSHLMNGGTLPWPELAMAGQFAENNYFGKPCGLMDQMACAGGGLMAIDFAEPGEPAWTRLDCDPESWGYRLAIVQTGGSHADLTQSYAAIPAEMMAVAALYGRERLRGLKLGELLAGTPMVREKAGDRAFLRALHFIKEDKRAAKMAKALAAGRFRRYLRLVRESGLSSRTLLQNIDAGIEPERQGVGLAISLSEEFLRGKGAVRVHGGGFAGTIQAYVPDDLAAEYKDSMEKVFGAGSVLFPGLREPGAVRVC
jgi:galactokinase